jgi:tetratricopeptide (TPR) repeat protein
MRFKLLLTGIISFLIFSCKQTVDRQPCDNHFIEGINKTYDFDFDNALKELNAATKENSKNAHAYTVKGSIAALNGDYDHAIKEFDTSLIIDPAFVFGYYHRAAAFAALGEHAKAIEDLNKVIDLKPDFSYAYYLRASYKHGLQI